MTPTLAAALDALGVRPAPKPAPAREYPQVWTPKKPGEEPPF